MSFQAGDIITSHCEEHRNLLEDQKAALCNLAFWCHPAWMDSSCTTLWIPAVTQLVMYHRVNMAIHKLTMAQIIGGVRGVIPDSKLAKYGDYRYDINFESMYCKTEDMKGERLVGEDAKHIDFFQERSYFTKSLDSETHQDCLPTCHYEKESELKMKKSLGDWLNKIKDVLEGAKQVAGVVQPLDSWTEEMIKVCLRFIYVASINDSVLQIMNSQIYFITDYEQPQSEEEIAMDLKEIDTLWLKLASPQVRKIWSSQETKISINIEELFGNQQSSLITVNFLRKYRQRQNSKCPSETLDVPQEVAEKLLGSLLQTIDETPKEPSAEIKSAETEHKSYFPQAHGDWTKQLFPHRTNSIPPLERETSTIKSIPVQNSAGKNPISELPSKMEPIVPPDGMIMPLHFYMRVPPPPLASAMRIQAIVRQQQYVIRQPRSSMVKVATKHPIPQQVQGKVPVAPIPCVPPQGLIQTPVPPNIWSYKCPQRISNPIQVTPQYPRINGGVIYQHVSPKDVLETSKMLLKKDVMGMDSTISRRNEILNFKRDKCLKENTETKSPNEIAWMAEKPLPQSNYETNIRFRVYQNTTRNCNTLQPVVYEKCNQQVLPSIYDMKQKPQFKVREPGVTTNVNNNNGLKFIRLPPLNIQHKSSPRSQSITPFINKPRFMGGITINDLRLVKDKLVYKQYTDTLDKQRGISIDDLLLDKRENYATSEEKVEKWLETVNHHMKMGTFKNIEKLSQSSLPEIVSKSDCKSDLFYEVESEGWYNSGNEMLKIQAKSTNATREKMASAKFKKKNARQLLLTQLYVFEGCLKLKKGSDLEGKVKFLKRYFSEINMNGVKFLSKHKIRNKSRRNKWFEISGKQKSAQKYKSSHMLGTKRSNRQPLPSNTYFEIARSFLANDFKILSRESNEFNAFPSKRLKMCNSMSLFLDKEPWTSNDLKGKISSINYFDMLTDDLFFSPKNPNVGIYENCSTNTGIITGWTHFQIVVKNILENILTTLNKLNIRGAIE